jgi:hypothetical protein
MWRHQQIPSLLLAVYIILNLYTLSARREYPLCIMAHCSKREREETGRVSNNPIDSPYGLKHSHKFIYFYMYMHCVYLCGSVLGPFYFVFYICERIIWKAARRLSAGQSCYTTGLFNLNNNAALCKRMKYFSNVSTHTRAAHRRVTLQMNYCGRLLEHWIFNIIYFAFALLKY